MWSVLLTCAHVIITQISNRSEIPGNTEVAYSSQLRSRSNTELANSRSSVANSGTVTLVFFWLSLNTVVKHEPNSFKLSFLHWSHMVIRYATTTRQAYLLQTVLRYPSNDELECFTCMFMWYVIIRVNNGVLELCENEQPLMDIFPQWHLPAL